MSPAAASPVKHRIKYTASEQHTRIITPKDVEAQFDLGETLEWGPTNGHALVVEDLSEEGVAFFRKDPDFSISEVKASDKTEG